MKPAEWTKQCGKMDKILKLFDERRLKLTDDVKKAKDHNASYADWDKIDLYIQEFLGDLTDFHGKIDKVLNSVPTDFLDPEYLSAQKRIPIGIVRVDLISKHARELLQKVETQRKVLRQILSMGEGLVTGLKENNVDHQEGKAKSTPANDQGKTVLREHRQDPIKIVQRVAPKAENIIPKPKKSPEPIPIEKSAPSTEGKEDGGGRKNIMDRGLLPVGKLGPVEKGLATRGQLVMGQIQKGTDGHSLLKKMGEAIINGIISLPVSAWNHWKSLELRKAAQNFLKGLSDTIASKPFSETKSAEDNESISTSKIQVCPHCGGGCNDAFCVETGKPLSNDSDDTDTHPGPISYGAKPIEISQAEIDGVLALTEVHNSENGNKALESLVRNDLGPKFRFDIENVTYYFSSILKAGDKRSWVVGYVQKEGKITARSYYFSRSQAIWRYLPNYIAYDGMIIRYDKGHGEDSLPLPFEAQIALSKIALGPTVQEKGLKMVCVKTARPNFEVGTYSVEINKSGFKLSVPIESPKPSVADEPDEEGRRKPILPNLNQVASPDLAPNFSLMISEWDEENSLYGMVKKRIFPSKNGTLRYMFCSDSRGRAWIGAIQNGSPIESTGLKREWVNFSDGTRPAYEYDSQVCNYGNAEDRKGDYVDFFKNYLSKTPLIQNYLTFLKEVNEESKRNELRHAADPQKSTNMTPDIYICPHCGGGCNDAFCIESGKPILQDKKACPHCGGGCNDAFCVETGKPMSQEKA